MIIMALVKRIMTQTIRDKRTLALMMFAPLIILSLVNFLFISDNTSNFNVGVYNTSESFNKELEKNDIEIIKYDNNENINDTIIHDSLKAFISNDNNKVSITFENSTPSDTAQIKAKIQGTLAKEQINSLTGIISKINNNLIKQQSSISIENNYVYEMRSYPSLIHLVLY